MPVSQKQTYYIYHHDVYGPRCHGYGTRPVCPVPESPYYDVIVENSETGLTTTWEMGGNVRQVDRNWVECIWIRPPTLQDAVRTRSFNGSFFRFFTNGDIQMIINGEPHFFSGTKEEVEAEKGDVRYYDEDNDNWSDKWSSDSYSDRGCHCRQTCCR